MKSSLVYTDGEFAVFFSKGIFCNCFSVYKKNIEDMTWDKQHDVFSSFLNLDAAKDYINKLKDNNELLKC